MADRLDGIFGDHPAAQRVVVEATEQLAQTTALLDPQRIVVGGAERRRGVPRCGAAARADLRRPRRDRARAAGRGVGAGLRQRRHRQSGGRAAEPQRVMRGHAVIGHATPIVASELGFDSVAIGSLAATPWPDG
jgi:hypothetical protein